MSAAKEILQQPLFSVIQKAADELNAKSYIIGGYVRDLILGRPTKDIDIVTEKNGIELAEKVAEKLSELNKINSAKTGRQPEKIYVTVYKNFGTAMLVWEGKQIEFVGARKESYRYDSRKPIVEGGTIEDDQNRRDFTINAMAISLVHGEEGKLIDPFEGLKDIDEKIIRTPKDPDLTFSDDPLRMMRAFRFATQLGFFIHKDTFHAIVRNKERIKIISAERIAEELNKIILSPAPSLGFTLLFNSGLLELIFPELVKLQGVEHKNGQSHKDNFYHTLQVLDNISQTTDDLWLRWAAVLHDIAKPLTKRFDPNEGWTFHGHEEKGARMIPGIFENLKLPKNEKMKYVQKLVRLHLRPIALADSEVTDSAIRRLLFEAGEDIDSLMKLCRADITSRNDAKVKRYLTNFDFVEKRMKEVEEKDHLRNWQPCITGEDIMKAFNLSPSPVIGKIKDIIREAILDGKIKNEREEAYAFMQKTGVELGLKAI
ncbi:MAG: tRNA nucleotidyltransferase [Bacteroidetes bacterium RIFCSPLOWO2_02_FULL_36_8]|nr:MAG: tRNA nucleotidyltransferase [Bacteroidetes bacterium RIFCSPLOWO2_02_FULL_36_8]OFY71823.1 MAG: tRNA nucleotidyltransferase [Bacteroidetes bacterium RIFCSPLOWO2_12_FULL_37_12]